MIEDIMANELHDFLLKLYGKEISVTQDKEITFTFTTETIQRVFSSPELLLHIFSFLPVPTLINNCRLVSRFWYRVVNIPPKIIAYINSLKKAKIYILMESTICDYSTSVSIVGAYANKTRATNQLIRNHIDGVIGHAYEYSPDGYYTCDLNDDHKVRSTGRKDKEGLVWELKGVTLDTEVEVVEEKDYEDEDYEYFSASKKN
ncbi:5875_t:CDS:2 [Entrophospora sp. SA101]|nr:5875_t:CDS:2 [Entrophospora sp. SA101]